MKQANWTITYDYLEEKFLSVVSDRHTVPFRLYDDDGTLYFRGYMSERLYESAGIFDPLDYTMNRYGCTSMKVKSPKTGRWETI